MYIQYFMPEIEKHKKLFPQFWMKKIFTGSVSDDAAINALTTMFVRLVEASLTHYASGCGNFKEYHSVHDRINLYAVTRAVTYFECCITNICRAVRCFRQLRKHPNLGALSDVLNGSKPLFISEAYFKIFNDIRNEIQHTEAILLSEGNADSVMFTLNLVGTEEKHPSEEHQTILTYDRLEIGKYILSFSDLAEMLTELGDYAELISSSGPSHA